MLIFYFSILDFGVAYFVFPGQPAYIHLYFQIHLIGSQNPELTRRLNNFLHLALSKCKKVGL